MIYDHITIGYAGQRIQQSNQSLFIFHQISFFDKKIGDFFFWGGGV
jgi:hypothetical protein